MRYSFLHWKSYPVYAWNRFYVIRATNYLWCRLFHQHVTASTTQFYNNNQIWLDNVMTYTSSSANNTVYFIAFILCFINFRSKIFHTFRIDEQNSFIHYNITAINHGTWQFFEILCWTKQIKCACQIHTQ